MKKVNICTLNGNGNYGNKLQHYALQTYLQSNGYQVDSTRFIYEKYYVHIIKNIIKNIINIIKNSRYKKFKKFDKKIFYSNNIVSKSYIRFRDNYDYYVVGSDQVWNPTFPSFNEYYLLPKLDKNKCISYAASFGISNIPNEFKDIFSKGLHNFNYLSVRENSGKKIIKDLTGRDDVSVVLDPTLLLSNEEWNKIIKKPTQNVPKKFILCYFIGNPSNSIKKEISKLASDNNCEIINLLDKNDQHYVSGPSEFLWYEREAFMICTDSFHSSVFAFLFDKSFIVFDREDKEQDMSSRIDTLLNTFELQDRKYSVDKIINEYIKHDYTHSFEILNNEKRKSEDFILKALGDKNEN